MVPGFVKKDQLDLVSTKLEFWKVVDTHVKENGIFFLLQLFNHGSQSFYYKTEGSAHGASEMRANLRSPFSHFQWEQKVVSQTINNLALNAFIGWRMYEKSSLLDCADSFGSLYSFRNHLNSAKYINFLCSICRQSYSVMLKH